MIKHEQNHFSKVSFLRSCHGESAYIIEEGWNLVVNQPEFRPHWLG